MRVPAEIESRTPEMTFAVDQPLLQLVYRPRPIAIVIGVVKP
jgi:hypothetical protein